MSAKRRVCFVCEPSHFRIASETKAPVCDIHWKECFKNLRKDYPEIPAKPWPGTSTFLDFPSQFVRRLYQSTTHLRDSEDYPIMFPRKAIYKSTSVAPHRVTAKQIARTNRNREIAQLRLASHQPLHRMYSMSQPSRAYRQGELKSVDVFESSAILSQTATFQLMNGIQSGSSFYNRIGNVVRLRSLHLIGQLVVNGTAPASIPEYDRVMVIYDRQSNGAFPALADVLTSYKNDGTTSSTVFDHLNMNNKDRFQVLCDIRLAIPYNTNGAPNADLASIIDYNGEYNINRFIKLKGSEVHFKASSNPSVIGDISTGAIFLMTVGSSVLATAPFTLDWSCRLRYYD